MTNPHDSGRLGPPALSVTPLRDLNAAERDEIVELCTAALETDCGNLFEFLMASTHVLARLDERLVGHACWWERRLEPDGIGPLRTAWVDAVSVAPSHQRRGIGTLVMRRLAGATAGFELVALGTERMPFFERLGWERWTGPTHAALPDAVDTLMMLRTRRTPHLDTSRPIRALG